MGLAEHPLLYLFRLLLHHGESSGNELPERISERVVLVVSETTETRPDVRVRVPTSTARSDLQRGQAAGREALPRSDRPDRRTGRTTALSDRRTPCSYTGTLPSSPCTLSLVGPYRTAPWSQTNGPLILRRRLALAGEPFPRFARCTFGSARPPRACGGKPGSPSCGLTAAALSLLLNTPHRTTPHCTTPAYSTKGLPLLVYAVGTDPYRPNVGADHWSCRDKCCGSCNAPTGRDPRPAVTFGLFGDVDLPPETWPARPQTP
ncbi:uncharacterized protein PSFLO_01366 [Pseudozyma flocculosa]|uniref:Uncharacterized protein n=1 Tax=Pseudozyma flocculosa TaxID=84751 RepID=A0A5C3EVX3_9BASI|nr:uncharacterized protein PSFLO_01366 [Pseudozyma flocculosa]